MAYNIHNMLICNRRVLKLIHIQKYNLFSSFRVLTLLLTYETADTDLCMYVLVLIRQSGIGIGMTIGNLYF